MIKVKCAICKKKTTVDTSYGRDTFIVCYSCFKRLSACTRKILDSTVDNEYKDYPLTLGLILSIGTIKEEN